jgi:hypothetical protein
MNPPKPKSASKFVFLSFRVKSEDKERFNLLSVIKGKTGVKMILDYVNSELMKPLKPSQIRKMPKEMQEKIWSEQSKLASAIFKKHEELNDFPDIVEDIK